MHHLFIAWLQESAHSLDGPEHEGSLQSETGGRQPLQPLPGRTSIADRLPPRPSELLKVCVVLLGYPACLAVAAWGRRACPAETTAVSLQKMALAWSARKVGCLSGVFVSSSAKKNGVISLCALLDETC